MNCECNAFSASEHDYLSSILSSQNAVFWQKVTYKTIVTKTKDLKRRRGKKRDKEETEEKIKLDKEDRGEDKQEEAEEKEDKR